MFNSSGPFTEIKFALHSDATALAKDVLPVPGSPKNKTPLGALVPMCLYNSVNFKGYSTDSFNNCLTSSNPPISSHVCLGISNDISLKLDGFIVFKAVTKSL